MSARFGTASVGGVRIGLEEEADLAGDLVREAGALAARIRAAGLDVERKTSVSDVVTQADHAAEAYIVERLTELRPDDGIVGEEGTSRPSKSGRTWVIDPVDGTYNFARGLDWWCSALALTGEDDVLLGAIHHVRDDATYVGGPTLAATRNGEPITELTDRPLAQACAATYLHPPYDGEVGAAFARAADGLATLRMSGSGSMDAVAIALGHYDVRFQHSVADWDRLPGAAIVRAVSGESRVVPAAGKQWLVEGVPTAVAEVCEALAAG